MKSYMGQQHDCNDKMRSTKWERQLWLSYHANRAALSFYWCNPLLLRIWWKWKWKSFEENVKQLLLSGCLPACWLHLHWLYESKLPREMLMHQFSRRVRNKSGAQNIFITFNQSYCLGVTLWQLYIYFDGVCGGGCHRQGCFMCQRNILDLVQIQTSDSSMFDGREAVDRLDNPDQAAVYWAPSHHHALRKPDAIFLSEFLIQPLSFDTSGPAQTDLYIMDLWETMHNWIGKTTQLFQQDPQKGRFPWRC